MSSPNESESWIDKYWQIFLIAYGIVFALILASFKPTT